ncbi:Membrane associated serine protease, rhomboid family [Anaerosporobacter mobilis DSM 15930]|uniref:Membrane associated serine protease, rhomboid family n=1 Tax=Anaerosporobacter mobilis DSM 15930 TaxID=1120996 RepID=A0A1M7IVE7_9FIRM|nr:rhomboid family intramembrane serine protease [Anaerosporobacter mobilis]SHM44720.1 Membrane associated serine protease, rhomboid family [Anaerosporobacter mobilis DSM 15930]
MISALIREFRKNNYEEIEVNNHNSAIFYQVKDEGIYIVSLFECVNNNDQSEKTLEYYNNRMSQMKWSFINQGYRNIKVLHVIISEDISEAREFIKDSDTYWIVNASTNQLVIFENQKPVFLDARESIERVLGLEDDTYDLKSKGNRVPKLIAYISPIAITCSILLINIIIFLIMDLSFDWSIYNAFVEQGGISYDTIVKDHQFYRFLTHMFIHADMDHLFGNMIVLFFIGSQVEKRLGKYRYLILYFIGGFVAAITSLGYNRIQDSSTLSIGASGAIFAVVGAMVAIVIFNKREFEEIGIRQLLFFVVISIINGMNAQGIDNAAHVGGLLAGLILGQVLYFGATNKKKGGKYES